MPLTEKAARIWRMFEEYRPLAMQHLVLPSPQSDKSSDRTFDHGPEMLLIRFLFPGIAEKGMQLLISVRQLRWHFRCAKRGDDEDKSIRSAHTEEQVEAMFAAKRAELEPLLANLSEVQQEIIREKFFGIEAD